MAGPNKEAEKKLNTSPKPGGSSPKKGNDVEDGAAAKPKGILDELDSKLDDLFALDDKEAKNTEKRQIIKSPLANVKEAPKGEKAAASDKDKAGKTKVPAPPAAAAKKGAVASTPQAAAPVDVGSKATGVQKQKETAPPVKKAVPAPIVKGATVEKKTETTSVVDKTPPPKSDRSQTQDRPVKSKKEPEKTGPKQGRKKHTPLKLTLGGIILAGGVLALLTFFQSPEPPSQSQPVAAPKAHKIIKSSPKALETKPTPPAVQTLPQGPKPAVSQPEVHAAATPADEKKPAPPIPAITAADEIQAFLQEWKAAWEKSAGKNGNTDAFMSFYSDDFRSNGFDKNKWRRDKAQKNRSKEWIRIQLDNITITGPLESGRYRAGFIQVYQSSNYSDSSNQVLVLKREASGWKIIGANPKPPTSYPYSIHDGSYRTLPPAQAAAETYRKMGVER